MSPPVRSNGTIGGDDGVIFAASDSSVGRWFQRRLPGFQASGVAMSLKKSPEDHLDSMMLYHSSQKVLL